jgi:endonuclease YncB( thermonuclease family)
MPPPAAEGLLAGASRIRNGQINGLEPPLTLQLTCAGVLHKVRLLGYDTPEIYHPLCPAEQQAGEAATDRMRRLVASGPVTAVRFAGHDRYGRDLAKVAIGGQDVAEHMLQSPFARPYAGHRHPDWCAILAP